MKGNEILDGYRPGVGAVIINQEQRVWLGKRRTIHPLIQKAVSIWQLPQGGIDANESPHSALWREVYEETGVKPECLRLIAESGWISYDFPKKIVKSVWGGKYKGQRQKWFLLKLISSDTNFNISVTDCPEFLSWKWATPNEACELVIDFKKSLYKDIFHTFKVHFYD